MKGLDLMLDAAIIGLGWWGRTLVESVQGSPLIRFVAAAAPNADAHAEFAAAHRMRLVTSLDEALADSSVQAVVLATPHTQHVDQIIACARAGVPVFSEKPLALNLVDAKRAVTACAEAGVVLGLGTDKRFLPAVVALRELVESGALGTVLHLEGQYSNNFSSLGVSGAWRASRSETPAGGLSGPGLHALDALLAMAGPAASAYCRLAADTDRAHPLDAVSVALTFASGAAGLLGSVRGVPDYFRLTVFGDQGWAEVAGFDTLRHTPLSGEPVVRRFDPGLAVGRLLADFARAASGTVAFPVTAESMLATVAAFEACVRSVNAGMPVEVMA
jgi:predicted dehydrogenase